MQQLARFWLTQRVARSLYGSRDSCHFVVHCSTSSLNSQSVIIVLCSNSIISTCCGFVVDLSYYKLYNESTDRSSEVWALAYKLAGPYVTRHNLLRGGGLLSRRSCPCVTLCDPIQPNPSADWPNPTQPSTTNNGAYSLVVTYFIHRTYQFLVRVRSAVKSNLTACFNQILSNRALSALT